MEQPELNDYLYWSQRLTREAMESHRVRMRRRSWSGSLGLSGPQISVGTASDVPLRAEIEERLLRKMDLRKDLTFKTRKSPAYAKGAGRVEMGQFVGWPEGEDSAYLHTRIDEGGGRPVDVVMFGSMSNYTSWVSGVQQQDGHGWVSSSAPHILRLLDGRRRRQRREFYDDQSLAVEALKIVQDQGITLHADAHRGLPASRDFTLGFVSQARWCARIYLDTTLDPGRWSRMEDLGDPRRILVGAALWVRADPSGLTMYTAEARLAEMAKALEREEAIALASRSLHSAGGIGLAPDELPVLEPDPQPAWRAKHGRSKPQP